MVGQTQGASVFESPMAISRQPTPHAYTNGHTALANGAGDDLKKNDDVGSGPSRQRGNSTWMPPGTKQEETWRYEDRVKAAS